MEPLQNESINTRVLQQGFFFIIAGLVISIVFQSSANTNGILFIIGDGNALLLIITGILGVLSAKEYAHVIIAYRTLLAIYGVILAGVYAFTALICLILILTFPNCEQKTSSSCNNQRGIVVAVIVITGVLVFVEFLLSILFAYSYRDAQQLQETTN